MVRISESEADANRIRNHLKTADPVAIELSGVVAMGLIANLQLALRHPENRGPTSALMRCLCDEVIEKFANGDATIETLMRRGYDPKFDVKAWPGG